MLELLILADDLTGAADSAARCFSAGLSATVTLTPPVVAIAAATLACASDSRHLAPERAAARVRRLARDVRRLHPRRWYKKIDSTLRGNLGAEIDALLDMLDLPNALICPAFPAQRRGLRAGFLVIDPPATDPPHLPSLLAQQSRYPIAAFDLSEVRAGAASLAERIAAARHTARLFVCDALSDADLALILDAATLAAPETLLCGSAGLVGALAPRLAASLPATPTHAMIDPPAATAFLVIGSGSGAARRQIDRLRRECVLNAYMPGMPPPRPGAVTLLHLPPPPANARLDGTRARRLATVLADTALEWIALHAPALLMLSGGATAIAVLRRLGVTRLDVARELLPGIPLCTGVDASGRRLAVILKPGNFGDERVLIDLLDQARSNG